MQHFFNISKSQNSKNIKVQLEVFFKIRQLFVVVPKIETTFSQRTRFAIYKSIYIIGGDQNGSFPSKKTWIVDPTNEFQIKEGPSLNNGRENHGCAKMTLNGRTILVVAGGQGEGLETLDSVEILDPSENNIWTQGMFLKFITVELCLINIIP